MARGSLRIERNSKGIEALLKSAPVQAELEARALRIADAANASGDGHFEASSWVGRDRGGGRSMAMVVTKDAAARRSNAEDNVLMRALDAGRG